MTETNEHTSMETTKDITERTTKEITEEIDNELSYISPTDNTTEYSNKLTEETSEEIEGTSKTSETPTTVPSSKAIESETIINEITIEEAEKRASIAISFRQINKFNYDSGTITFMLFTLISANLNKGHQIKLLVNLIKMNGEREDHFTEITCVLQQDVTYLDQSIQGDFQCILSGLEEEYYSLRLFGSNDISGIPDDEVALDPVLTSEAIKKNKLLDYSLVENQSIDKIPAGFTISNIKEEACRTNGIFIIEGTLSKDIENELSFSIPLTFPDGIKANCNILDRKKGQSQISCQVDRAIENSNIAFEKIIIKDGIQEILNLEGFSSKEIISCSNGLLLATEEKIENVKVSFRQVSYLYYNGINGFKFFLATFANKDMNAGQILPIKISVLVGEDKKEKEAKCTLRNNVQVQEGKITQASFDCEVSLEEGEYKQIQFNNIEAIKISANNEDIAGVLDEDGNLSPLATDIAINETIAKKEANEILTDLAECLDYSLEENINRELLSFEIVSIANINQCSSGKVTIIGKFSSKIGEETIFDLPLSYPQTSFKCTVPKAEKDE